VRRQAGGDGGSDDAVHVSGQRVARLHRALAAAGIDGAAIRRPANVAYLTGYPAPPSNPAFAIVGHGGAVLVAPGSADAIRPLVTPGVQVVGYDVPGLTVDRVVDGARESAVALEAALDLAGLGGRRIGIEETQISRLHADVVARLGTAVALSDEVEALRRIKEPGEIALIRAAAACNDLGFQAARGAIAPGATELAVQDAIVAAMQRAAGAPIDVLDDTSDLLSGPRTLGFGHASPREMEAGDLVVIDLNPFVRQYKGDTTRTFCVGPPSAEQRRMHDAVIRALEAMERVARPGVPGRDVYAAFVDRVVAAGYGRGLRGHGGHAIGLEHFERPYVIAGDEMRLEEGMTISFEPGIYVPEVGGVRVEENYLVTAGGLERLSRFPRELLACPG
jgi:Xaa-Pro aminopeptidase